MIAIGIDPGVSGGIAAIDHGIARAVKMPATERDILEALNLLLTASLIGETRVYAVLEKAQPMPKQGVVSVFTYGRGYGALLMALTVAGVPFDEVTSPVWQQAMGCRSRGDKNVTKRRAQQLFPGITITHAIADALLIAEFCRRTRGSHGEATSREATGRAEGGRAPRAPKENPTGRQAGPPQPAQPAAARHGAGSEPRAR